MELQNIGTTTTWNEAAGRINFNNQKIGTELMKLGSATYKNKGYFKTLSDLQSAFPTATVGSKAYVGLSYPYKIYLWENNSWVDSKATGGDDSALQNAVDLNTEQTIIATKTFRGGINMNGTRISKVGSPVNTDDAANKEYVDSKIDDIPIEKGSGVDSVIQKGGYNNASGDYSFAEGISTKATGNSAHSEGNGTTSSGENSHAEGSNTTASGTNSHAEGYQLVASGLNSHAEGYKTAANNAYSHSEGGNTISNGKGSHSEGYNTLADNNHSHAEGYGTKAYSLGSHAEGYNTIAGIKDCTSGCSYSHAEGHSTQAEGQYSHSEGYNTKTLNESEHAEGKYNLSIKDKTIHTVGIGSSENDKKNAHEIHADGKHYIFGIGGYDGKNSQTEGIKSLQNVIANSVDLNTEQTITAKKTFSAGINLNGTTISKVGSPVNTDDAANKQYVDDATGNIVNIEANVEALQYNVDEIYGRLEQYQLGIAFDNYQSFLDAARYIIDDWPVGQNIYIRQLDVPDIWVSKVFRNVDHTVEYTYTTDEQFIQDVRNGVQIWHHQFSLLETAKVDLSNTASKAEVTALQAEVAALKAIINEITIKE